jgi:hypothetical protein
VVPLTLIAFASGDAEIGGTWVFVIGVPQAGEEGASEAAEAARSKEPKKRTPRVDWEQLLRRTFALDVFACARCGGRRQELA